jgi:hypothetical protein
MIRDQHIDGKLQIIAAMSLLEFSRLVLWDAALSEFTAVPRDSFVADWQTNIDPVFGRLICWINFSAGAEYLAKGVCLLRNVEIRKPKGLQMTFGTLGDLYNKKDAALRRLAAAANATESQQRAVIEAYKHLATDIRNRDAHAYVPGVRNDHFHDVGSQFVPCFNLLVRWLPGGASIVNEWRDDAPHFIASLVRTPRNP